MTLTPAAPGTRASGGTPSLIIYVPEDRVLEHGRGSKRSTRPCGRRLSRPKWRNGRRAGLKIRWGNTRVGSSPTFGTKDLRRLGVGFVSLTEALDLTTPGVLPGSPWDLAVCCEGAEHLDARHADTFVENLTSGSNTVFLTAAEVGQGGLNHVNEQPNSYWIAKFGRLGFTLDGNLTADARAAFAESEVVHYLAKPMIFRRVEK